MNKKYRKVCAALYYIGQFVILISAVAGCNSISDFVAVLGIPKVIIISILGLKICAITAGVKKCKSKIKKEKRKYDETVLLRRT